MSKSTNDLQTELIDGYGFIQLNRCAYHFFQRKHSWDGFSVSCVQRPSCFGESMRMSSIAAFCSRRSACSFPLRSCQPPFVVQWAGFTVRNRMKGSWMKRAVETTTGYFSLMRNTSGHLVEASFTVASVGVSTSRWADANSNPRWVWIRGFVRTWGSIALEIALTEMGAFIHKHDTGFNSCTNKRTANSRGRVSTDGLPKRAVRTARRLLVVYFDDQEKRPVTRADRAFCRNWTAHKRNVWVVRVGYRRVFCPYLKIPKKYGKIQFKNTKSELQGLENATGWICIFFAICFLISKVNMGLALWLIFEFVFSLYFVFLKFCVRIFFCILYVRNFWFVFFGILYFWEIAFVFVFVFFGFFLYFHKKQSKIQKYFVFFVFSITSKYSLCIFVFFHSFTDCTLSFCIFRSLDMPSKNKTANPPMYVVFSFCWWFCPPQCCIFL